MLDPAMIDALAHALKPIPAIVRPAAEFGESIERFRQRALKQIADGEADLSAWIAEGEVVEKELSARLGSAQAVKELSADAIRDYLDRVIETADARNAANAAEFDQMAASFKRQIKQAAAIGKRERDMVRTIADAAMSLMQRELEERGDFALFLRSWRARFSDGRHASPSFTDPKALRRHLEAALAS